MSWTSRRFISMKRCCSVFWLEENVYHLWANISSSVSKLAAAVLSFSFKYYFNTFYSDIKIWVSILWEHPWSSLSRWPGGHPVQLPPAPVWGTEDHSLWGRWQVQQRSTPHTAGRLSFGALRTPTKRAVVLLGLKPKYALDCFKITPFLWLSSLEGSEKKEALSSGASPAVVWAQGRAESHSCTERWSWSRRSPG